MNIALHVIQEYAIDYREGIKNRPYSQSVCSMKVHLITRHNDKRQNIVVLNVVV